MGGTGGGSRGGAGAGGAPRPAGKGREIIGRGTWIDKLAREMLDREVSLGRSLGMVRVESGLGASGVPHLGSLGDAARAYAVCLAVRDAGHASELLAYSDDMDGLRRVPEGLPAWLGEHLAKPVSAVPDPRGCHDSYGSHMSSLLLEGLDALGIRYAFRSARDAYGRGLLAGQARAILSEASRIGEQIERMVGQDKFRRVLPYYPVCERCGRLYTTEALRYHAGEGRVEYRCAGAGVGGGRVPGCGHSGEADVARDPGKLAWKVEFAARWQAFDVRFEAYGKDIMDSVRVNDWVCSEVLGTPPPHHARYEMFLDKGGRKISKSVGGAVTAQQWLRYGTPQSLLLLMYKRMRGARGVGLEDVPALMDECMDLEEAYHAGGGRGAGMEAKERGLLEYVHLLEPPEGPPLRASYRILLGLARAFREDRERNVVKRLASYGDAGGDPDEKEKARIAELVRLAGNYADDFPDEAQREARHRIEAQSRTAYRIESNEARPAEGVGTGRALADLAVALDAMGGDPAGGDPAGAVRDAIREAAGRNGVEMRDLCRAVYRVLLGADRGPRLGQFILDTGPGRVAERLRKHTG